MQQPTPGDPFTALGAGMVQMHEMYQGAVDAGFKPDQAMDLVKEMMKVAMVTGNQPCPHCGRKPNE